jgi:hypothetical protein
MITGLMWTEGAKLSKLRSKTRKLCGEIKITDPNSQAIPGTAGEYDTENIIASSFDGSTPFILGIRVRKIWWDKTRIRHDAHDTVGAALGDRKGPEMTVLEGLRFIDDEVDAETEHVLEEVDEIESDPVIWMMP